MSTAAASARWSVSARAGWSIAVILGAAVLVAAIPAAVAAAGRACAGACAATGGAEAVVGALAAVVWLGVGAAVLLAGRPGWVTAISGVAILAHPVADAVGLLAPGVPGVAAAAVAEGLGLLALTLLPDARSSRRWLVVAVAAAGVVHLGLATGLFGSDSVSTIDAVLFFAVLIAIVVDQIVRYRTALDPIGRRRMRWIVLGAGLFAVVDIASSVPYFLPTLAAATTPGSAYDRTQSLLAESALLLIPISIGIALLREQLFDVDVLIRRTAVYGLVVAVLTAVYLLIVFGIGTAAGPVARPLLPLVGAIAAALLFQPLRTVLQGRARLLLLGLRDDPYAALSALGRRLGGSVSPDRVPDEVAEAIREALAAPYVAVAVRDGTGFRVVAERGAATGTGVTMPVVHLAEEVARVTVGTDAMHPITDRDRLLLADLAAQAGAALHGSRLLESLHTTTEQLRTSRELLLLAREEERRRLRADLHDQLAPALSGAGLTVEAAAALVATEPDRARALLDRLGGSLRSTVGDIRRLVDDLRPAALDELGLEQALRDRAEQLLGRLDVRFEVVGPLDGLPAATEVAVYRIGQEALMNVAKHAGAGHCTVRLERQPDAIRLTVADDGRGIPSAAPPGVGLRSMRERAAELGGLTEVVSTPAGTAVRVRLPIGGAA